MQKKLYKSDEDRKLCGVCGGLAEYIDIDSTLVRLVWVLLTFCAGLNIIVYIVAAIIMPNKPAGYYNNNNNNNNDNLYR